MREGDESEQPQDGYGWGSSGKEAGEMEDAIR